MLRIAYIFSFLIQMTIIILKTVWTVSCFCSPVNLPSSLNWSLTLHFSYSQYLSIHKCTSSLKCCVNFQLLIHTFYTTLPYFSLCFPVFLSHDFTFSVIVLVLCILFICHQSPLLACVSVWYTSILLLCGMPCAGKVVILILYKYNTKNEK